MSNEEKKTQNTPDKKAPGEEKKSQNTPDKNTSGGKKRTQNTPKKHTGDSIKTEQPSSGKDGTSNDAFVLKEYDDSYEVFEEPEEGTKKKKKRKKKKGILSKLFLFLFILAVAFSLAFTILICAKDMMAIGRPDEEIQIEIVEGTTVQEIAQMLEDEGIIDYALVFRLSIKLQKAETFHSGFKILNPAMSHREIIDVLQEKSPGGNIKIVFVEGQTIHDYAEILEQNGICNADEFLKELNKAEIDYEPFQDLYKSLPSYWVFEEEEERIPNNEYIYNRMEGYVFPATHDFALNTPVKEVVEKVLQPFNTIFDDSMMRKKEERGWTLHELMTFASIIEKEASVGENPELKRSNMKAVSSVFHNRLNNPDLFPNLQSDPTITYVENYIKPFIPALTDDGTPTPEQQSMYDAYNTYKCTGIPVGPICNPGIDAIQAALKPIDSNNFFFVTDADGNFYFAATNEEHEQNCLIAGVDIRENMREE